MSALGSKLRLCEGGMVQFKCPGCNDTHMVSVNSGIPGRNWTFNGDGDRPTFTPSVLVRNGHHVPGRQHDSCWCTYNAEQIAKGEAPSPFKCGVCHSFVTDGQIQFLGDCTHHLSGKTVPLPDFS